MGGKPGTSWGTIGGEFLEEAKNNYVQGLPFAAGAGLINAAGGGAALSAAAWPSLLIGGGAATLALSDAIGTGFFRGAGLTNSIYKDGTVYNKDRTWQGDTFYKLPEIAEINRQRLETIKTGKLKAEADDPLSRTISSGVDAAVKWTTDPGNEINYIKNQAQESFNWLKGLFIN